METPTRRAPADQHKHKTRAKFGADGFAALRSFDPTTPEHESLAQGYEEVSNNMVWGERIPLREAIRLAVSLDPGPSEPYRPPEPNPLVAYPRH
ncbi:hypothetical protein [Candidatus Poriferisodalis sp.]|uniref:hypothetical protein n=1 Tax=Candidatus Poriferisodalis sp. TaxID=3101277 RepID=UPI003B023278